MLHDQQVLVEVQLALLEAQALLALLAQEAQDQLVQLDKRHLQEPLDQQVILDPA